MGLERLPRWPCLPLRSERHDRGLRGQWRAAAWAQAVRAVGAARAHAAHAVAMEDMPALQLDAAVRERIEAQHAVDAWLPRVRQLGVGFLAAEAAGHRGCSLPLLAPLLCEPQNWPAVAAAEQRHSEGPQCRPGMQIHCLQYRCQETAEPANYNIHSQIGLCCYRRFCAARTARDVHC